MRKQGFGTAPVFFTAISTILGAILFLRFGFAAGTLGFWGVMLIILIGHSVTIPTALALSEIATNQQVRNGGEYFIISRSFGLNIGATIGIFLFLSQAISVAFYVIAFTEAFEFFFIWARDSLGLLLPRQVISLPAMALLAWLILSRGASLGVKALYVVVGILLLSLAAFFLGTTEYAETAASPLTEGLRNRREFFFVFAIVFPAFTGMTAGVGLSGDLRNPAKSIPRGTITATVAGMLMYIFIAWKLVISASPEGLTGNQLIMGDIALGGKWIIPLGLAASTISSAIGSVMVAPRTLQALGGDRSFPLRRFNIAMARGKGQSKEPFNASIVTIIIAFVFVAMGDVNAVAEIISMFFMVTYGSLCLISFLYHFGAQPSYRPTFRSKWYLSLLGAVMCIYLMFKINTPYALAAGILLVGVYFSIRHYHKNRRGMESIFQGTVFQLSRNLQVYIQRKARAGKKIEWRPAAVCLSTHSYLRDKGFDLINWISYRFGFGTYIYLKKGYFSKQSNEEARRELQHLLKKTEDSQSNVFVDVLISPSYTAAISQIIQLPGVSGMDNNLFIFEHPRDFPEDLPRIVENVALVSAADMDVGVLLASPVSQGLKKGIDIWIRSHDYMNANLMILLGFIIRGHPDWKKGDIRIFEICREKEMEATRARLVELVEKGRLPVLPENITHIPHKENVSAKSTISDYSRDTSLVIQGFRKESLKHDGSGIFEGYDLQGDILFLNAASIKDIL